MLADAGYAGEPFAVGVREIRDQTAAVQIDKRGELRKFVVIPRRWVGGRSFVWLKKNRQLRKSCRRELDTHLQLTHLAFLALLLTRA